jgi:phosphonate metabolism protein (transferase hexapeptide repeat family)
MGKQLGPAPLVHPTARVTNSTLGRYTELGEGAVMLNSELGDYSYAVRFADIANATIGKFANIASYVRIGATDHPMDRASQHHFLYRSADYWEDAPHDEAFFAHRASRRITIGHDTWLGHDSMVMPEVTVGHGAVVAAGAIVTRDVPDYAVVAGVPARFMRWRHEPPLAARLMALAWWDWDHDRLRGALEDFRSLGAAAFVEKYG